jgi:transglutaminase-like putative cysteine protease
MLLTPQYHDLNFYLQPSDVIDFDTSDGHAVIELAGSLKARSHNKIDYIKNAFEYVRDEISHSADIHGKVVTCSASQVLRAKEGICFAKSHLLAALLRCQSVPTGFCYQRLVLDDGTAPYLILHGLNAVYLEELRRWIRCDARGNKQSVHARFSLNEEQLAFPVRVEKGEEDIPIVFANPDRNVISALTGYQTFDMLWKNLPTELSQDSKTIYE